VSALIDEARHLDEGDRTPVLEAREITKSYGHVRALGGANLSVFPGEIVAIVGDNGAGKSTLVKALGGAHQPDSGTILYEGRVVTLESPLEARSLGIEIVYQDLALASDLDATANVFLGRETLRSGFLGRLGFIDRGAMRAQAAGAFERLGVTAGTDTRPLASYSGGQRQGVAVARSVMWATKVLFLDEPTAALAVIQATKVLELIRRVADTGVGVVLVSHNLPQVVEIADRVEVFRLGRRVAKFRRDNVSTEALLAAMTGALVHEDGAS
jgi:simple sugar transport system ATP-binding protein